MLQSICFANTDICLYIGGYTLFFRLLYAGIGGLGLLSLAGLISPEWLFGSRVFAGVSLFASLQLLILTVAMQHY